MIHEQSVPEATRRRTHPSSPCHWRSCLALNLPSIMDILRMIHRPLVFYFYPNTHLTTEAGALQSIGKLPSFVGRQI
jgi:hypothetical protein